MRRKTCDFNSMNVLFLDESGDHRSSIVDPQYPVFVLGGVIMDDEYAESHLTKVLNEFKREMFDATDVVLHTADITRNRNGFELMKDTSFRSRFYCRLNGLMRNLQYSVVACVIQKEEFLRRRGETPLDLYAISLGVLAERFCLEVCNVSNSGAIVAESRGSALDGNLMLAWSRLKSHGTHYLKGAAIEDWIVDLRLRTKNDEIAGLELADLVVSPIGRHVLGKPDKEDWEIVEGKLLRGAQGQVEGHGLVILPKDNG